METRSTLTQIRPLRPLFYKDDRIHVLFAFIYKNYDIQKEGFRELFD